MAKMIYFTKSECTSGQQHRTRLQQAGNELLCKDILTRNWTREKLLPFVRGRNPLDIIDSSAKPIRQGKIDPVLMSFDEAVSLLVRAPELIKGPLVEVEGRYIQGEGDTRLLQYL